MIFHNIKNVKPEIGETILAKINPNLNWGIKYCIFYVAGKDTLEELGRDPDYWTYHFNVIEAWISLEDLDKEIDY